MTCKYTLLLCLLFAAFCIAASDKTCSGFGLSPDTKPQQLKKPAVCCWYEESSCCTSSDISQIAATNQVLTALYNQKTNSSNDVPSGFDKCFTYVESILCSSCAPDTATFYAIDTEADNSTTVRIHLCQDWCDDFYASCQEPFAAFLDQLGVSNGTSLCQSFNVIHLSDLNVTTTTPSTTTKVKTPSSTPSPTVTTKKAKTPTATPTLPSQESETSYEPVTTEASIDSLPVYAPAESYYDEEPSVPTKKQAAAALKFEFVVSTSACYEGPSSEVIGRSGCTPWKAENYQSSGGFWWYWILILVGVLGICIILAIAVAIVAFFVYKRRTAATVTVKEGEDYPNLEELE